VAGEAALEGAVLLLCWLLLLLMTMWQMMNQHDAAAEQWCAGALSAGAAS
jgi:hypothetical protein